MRIATTSARCALIRRSSSPADTCRKPGPDLASQPTLSRLENAPTTCAMPSGLTYALIDQWMESYATAPDGVVLDIDDTCDVVHGHQQLSLFNAHYDERCFLPIHVYDSATGRPVAVVLRPGKTPSGIEVRAHLRRLVRRIRDALASHPHHHPGRQSLCPSRGHGRSASRTASATSSGWPARRPLTTKVQDIADAVRTQRALEDREVVRGFAETTHRAKSWSCERRVVARIEATRLGLDIRFVVTNLTGTSPRVIYESLYCARGQAENWIKFHKAQLASDRTSCRRAGGQPGPSCAAHGGLLADAVRARGHPSGSRSCPGPSSQRCGLRLLKIAVRVQEGASRIRLAFASCCPEADLVRRLVGALAPQPRAASP